MSNVRFAIAAGLVLSSTIIADAQTRMLRSPSVSKTNIAFAYAGNIGIVDRAGGPARRLTTLAGEAGIPNSVPTANSSRSTLNALTMSTSTLFRWKAADAE